MTALAREEMKKYLLVAAVILFAAPTIADEDLLSENDERDSRALGPKIEYPPPPKERRSVREYYYNGGRVNSYPFQSPAQSLEVIPGLAVQ